VPPDPPVTTIGGTGGPLGKNKRQSAAKRQRERKLREKRELKELRRAEKRAGSKPDEDEASVSTDEEPPVEEEDH
jgi:hypothetical protein